MSEYSDNYYARLGIPFDATRDEVRNAYHDAARRLHPDANPATGAVEQFLRIQEAYEALSESQKRKDYDNTLPSIDTSSGITMEIVYSRSGLVLSPDPQLLYLMMEIIPIPTNKEVTIPLNLCIVIDRSTSMQGERMDIVKSTAKNLVRQLRPIDYLSIVAYSDRAEVIVPAIRISNGIERIESQISLLQTGGGTEMFRGLEAGFEEITRFIRPNFVNHLILITDGYTYGDEAACLGLADQAREVGVTISGLGIGNEWNDKFLDNLTTKTGGSSTYVADPRDIKRFMELKFKGLNQVFAENTALNLKLSPDVEIHYAFRLGPEPAKFPVELPLNLGNIQSDSGLTIVFELFIKKIPSQSSMVLMEGTLRYEVPTRIIPTIRTPISISRPVENADTPQKPPPQKIVQAMSRLTLYRLQEQAKQDLEAGNIEQATRRLRFLATHLLAQGETSLATTVLGEAGRIERDRSLSDEGEKRIKYGTRALLLPSGTGVNL
jgi:Ca-activated chloride channel homolog